MIEPTRPTESNTGRKCAGAGPAIRAGALRVAYHGRAALQDVSLSIAAKRITAIVGPSGCGKTSFLMALNRLTDLIPGCTVGGELNVGGADVLDRELDVVAHRRRVGMIFQKPNPFPLSIWRNLELPLKEIGLRDRRDRGARIEGTLRDVGLWKEVKDRLNSPAVNLSGGQQQRLCLARALSLQPEVLLLDEPCSALDPVATGVVEDLIRQFRERFTVVIVTHNLAQARRLADDISVFWTDGGPGVLLEHGPCEQVFGAPQHESTRSYLQGRQG